jgi:hypothetical protein
VLQEPVVPTALLLKALFLRFLTVELHELADEAIEVVDHESTLLRLVAHIEARLEKAHRLLAVTTSDGLILYPALQLAKEGGVLPALRSKA